MWPVPSLTRMMAKSRPEALTEPQLMLPWNSETSMPSTVWLPGQTTAAAATVGMNATRAARRFMRQRSCRRRAVAFALAEDAGSGRRCKREWAVPTAVGGRGPRSSGEGGEGFGGAVQVAAGGGQLVDERRQLVEARGVGGAVVEGGEAQALEDGDVVVQAGDGAIASALDPVEVIQLLAQRGARLRVLVADHFVGGGGLAGGDLVDAGGERAAVGARRFAVQLVPVAAEAGDAPEEVARCLARFGRLLAERRLRVAERRLGARDQRRQLAVR